MARPAIAIIGRPNVGKSTLFNRLVEKRKAIVDAKEGITRDRIRGTLDWENCLYDIVDTGGYIPDDVDVFNSAVREQAELAVFEADFILFLVDGKADPTASDKDLAKLVRKSGKPHMLVVNKCDTLETDGQQLRFHELAIEPMVTISALNGRLTGVMLEQITAVLNPAIAKQDEEENRQQERQVFLAVLAHDRDDYFVAQEQDDGLEKVGQARGHVLGFAESLEHHGDEQDARHPHNRHVLSDRHVDFHAGHVKRRYGREGKRIGDYCMGIGKIDKGQFKDIAVHYMPDDIRLRTASHVLP